METAASCFSRSAERRTGSREQEAARSSRVRGRAVATAGARRGRAGFHLLFSAIGCAFARRERHGVERTTLPRAGSRAQGQAAIARASPAPHLAHASHSLKPHAGFDVETVALASLPTPRSPHCRRRVRLTSDVAFGVFGSLPASCSAHCRRRVRRLTSGVVFGSLPTSRLPHFRRRVRLTAGVVFGSLPTSRLPHFRRRARPTPGVALASLPASRSARCRRRARLTAGVESEERRRRSAIRTLDVPAAERRALTPAATNIERVRLVSTSEPPRRRASSHSCRFAGSWGHPELFFAGSWGHPFRSMKGPPAREG